MRQAPLLRARYRAIVVAVHLTRVSGRGTLKHRSPLSQRDGESSSDELAFLSSGLSVRDQLKEIKNRAFAGHYGSEEEFRLDIVVVIKSILERLGVDASVDAERRIIRGRPDARVGALLFELERPPLQEADVDQKKVSQLQGYINDTWRKDRVKSRGIATNGVHIVLLDESAAVVDRGDIVDKAWAFEAWVSTLALRVVEPKDFLSRIGPRAPLGSDFISTLYTQFQANRGSIPFVADSFEAWRGVYGNAVNLTREVIEAVRRYAQDSFSLQLRDKVDVEHFLFVTETYLSVLMKLLVVRTMLQKLMVAPYPSIAALLGTDQIEAFRRLAERVPVMRNAFEADVFTWFSDVAQADRNAAKALNMRLGDLVRLLDLLDLSQVSTDLLRHLYQDFFEPSVRTALGEFYTSEDLVDEVLDAAGFKGAAVEDWAREATSASDSIILDPACGSGTFLIRLIERLKQTSLPDDDKLKVAAERIVGIDIHPFAVAMARSNFILAVADLYTLGQPFPAKIPVYWADSLSRLVEETKIGGSGGIHSVFRLPIPVLGTFELPDPKMIPWENLVLTVRRAVDDDWTTEAFFQEMESRYGKSVLLFRDQLKRLVEVFRDRKRRGLNGRWISLLSNVFMVQAARKNCFLVCGNPPWVRVHNISPDIRDRLSETEFFRQGKLGWNPGYEQTKIPFRALPDYSMAFVEAGISFLRPAGTLAFLITSKVQQALYANLFRHELRTRVHLRQLVDYSLSPRPLFQDAVNYPLILVASNSPPGDVHIVVVNAAGKKADWKTQDFSLTANDPGSPWLMAPPSVISIFRKMQKAGPRLGDLASLQVGILTQRDQRYYIEEFEDTTSSSVKMAHMRSGESIRLEENMILPIVEGEHIREWLFQISKWILWTHDKKGEPLTSLPPEALNYLSRRDVRRELEGRSDYRRLIGQQKRFPYWMIFRVDVRRLGAKVLWRDLATRMEAVFVPAHIRAKALGVKSLVPGHTTYCFSVPSESVGYALVGLLNSTPVRAFLKAFCERARGAHYRHFSWAVGAIPVFGALAASLNRIRLSGDERKILQDIRSDSRRIHKIVARGEMASLDQEQLDKTVAAAYGLSEHELKILNQYDEFMRSDVAQKSVMDVGSADDGADHEEIS
jgi:SAM-dependent methyltransferase